MQIIGNSSRSYFEVTGYGAADNQIELFVNTTQSYEGMVRLDQATMILEVTAADEWERVVE